MIKDADIEINGYLTNIIGYTIILVSKMCFLPSHSLYSLKGSLSHSLKIAVVRRVPEGIEFIEMRKTMVRWQFR